MIALLLISSALAAQVSLRLDSRDVREGQTIGLDLVVTDTASRTVPELVVPDGLQVVYQGQAQQRQIINFQSTSSTIYSFELTALRPGDFTIPAVNVATQAGVLATAPLQLHVGARPSGSTDALVADLAVDVAYVGQVLVYELRFQTANRVVNGRWGPPDAPGLTAEPSVEPVSAEYRTEQGNTPVSVMELHYPLRAAKAGSWTVPAGVLNAQFAVKDSRPRRPGSFIDGIGAFGNVRTEVYSSDPIALEIREIPKVGRPPNATDLVGQFQIEAKVAQREARVDDTVTIEVSIEGDGALGGFTLPPLSGDGFRVYDDQPVVDTRIEDGHYRSRATFKRAIVPQAPGALEVPGIDLAWFDPVAGRWTEGHTDPVRLTVTGSASGAKVESFAGADTPHTVDALGEDILPVRTNLRLSPPPPRALSFALVLPGLLALGAQLVGSLSARRRVRVAEERLDFDMLPSDPDGRLAGIERIFRERLGERLEIAPELLRREDLVALGAAAVEADSVYRELERARYGAEDVRISEARVRALVEGL